MRTHIAFVAMLLSSLLAGKKLSAQDLSFSQFYEQPLLRNPALAGVFGEDIRVSGVFRNQWQSVTVPFQTGAASFEYRIPFNQYGDWLTLGLQASHDVAGDVKLKRTQLLPVVNFHKTLNQDNETYLSLAFMGGPVNSQFDPTALKMDEQWQGGQYNPLAPVQTFQRTGFNYWDASVGLSYSSSYGEDVAYYLGAGLFHFNKPKVAFYTSNSNVQLASKFVLNAGVRFNTSEANRLIGYADYFTQAGHRQFLLGALYTTDLSQQYESDRALSLSFGGAYRWADAFIPVVKLDVYRLSLGLSYDVNTSQLKTASNWRGGMELTLGYRASLRHRNEYAEKTRCFNGF